MEGFHVFIYKPVLPRRAVMMSHKSGMPTSLAEKIKDAHKCGVVEWELLSIELSI